MRVYLVDYLTCFTVTFLSPVFPLFYPFFFFPCLVEIKISSLYLCLAAWKWMVFDNDLIQVITKSVMPL